MYAIISSIIDLTSCPISPERLPKHISLLPIQPRGTRGSSRFLGFRFSDEMSKPVFSLNFFLVSSGPINIAELPYRSYGPSVTRPRRNRSHANSAVLDYVIIVCIASASTPPQNFQPKVSFGHILPLLHKKRQRIPRPLFHFLLFYLFLYISSRISKAWPKSLLV